MSRSTLLLIGAFVVTFASGLAVGLFLGDSDPAAKNLPGKSAANSSFGFFSSPQAQERVSDNTLLSDRIRQLDSELAEQKKNQDSAAIRADRLKFFEKHHEQIRLQAFGADLSVTPEMGEILDLSPEELKVVNQHMSEVKNVMDQFEQNNTGVVKQTTNSFVIETPVNPQAKVLKDNLATELSSDIGEDRSKLLLDYADFSPFGALAQLASEKKDVDIEWTTQNGKPQYTIKNEFFNADGHSQGWSTTSSDSIPSQYLQYVQTSPP